MRGADPREIRTAGDATSQRYLAARLADERPTDAVLSEEAHDDRLRLQADRVWIIDPLDGTREYAEGRDDWAVHVALWENGQLSAGAVALPARGMVLATDAAQPLPGRAVPPPRPRFVASRTRAPALVERVADALGGEILPLGSAGAKTAAVVLDEADAYVHSGGMHEWDSAAPVAVALAASLHVSRFDGSPVTFNTPSALTTELVVCHPALADPLLHALAATPSP